MVLGTGAWTGAPSVTAAVPPQPGPSTSSPGWPRRSSPSRARPSGWGYTRMTTRMSTAGMYIVLNVQFCKNRDAVRVFPKYVQYPDPVSLQYIQCCGSKLSNSIRIRIRDILHGYNLQLPVNINLKKDFKKWSKSYKKNNACEESSEFLSLSHVSFFNGNNTAYFYL